MRYVKWAGCLVVLALFAGVVFNQEAGPDKDKGKKPDKEKKDADKPATHKVARKAFKIEVTASGILSSDEAAEVAFRPHPILRPPEGLSSLTVKKVVGHATAVKKGDVLLALDTTKLDENIENEDQEQKTLEASIKLAEHELPIHERTAPVELASAEQAKKRADEELKYFLDIGRAQTEKYVNLRVKADKFYLEYAEEELVQLKKMYKANDLTEETERMILRRQQNYVEFAKAYYDSALIERDYMFKYTLPNREKSLKEDQAKSDIALEKARKTWAPWLTQKQISLAKMRHEFAQAAERLDKLKKDRAAMTLIAPMDGVVYHGRFQQGNWSVSESVDSKLQPGGTVQPDKVLLTVLKPRPSEIHVSIDEKEVHLVKPDMRGTAKLPAWPSRKLAVRVVKVSGAPVAPGKFSAVVRLDGNDPDLVPGLACNLKFVAYAKKDALTVPTKCVFDDDDKDVVYVHLPNGKSDRCEVTLGRSDGKDTEVLAGLREGDEVVLERPGAKSEKGATP